MHRALPWFFAASFCSTAALAQSSSPPPAVEATGESSAPPTLVAPVATVTPPASDDSWHAPGPGRVPLVVESAGGRQSVGLTLSIQGRSVSHDDLCFTPCTLYVPPADATLLTYGPGIAETETDFIVGERGLRVRMRAPSETALVAGRALTVLGVLAEIAGAVLLITGISDVANAHGAPAPLGLVISGSVTLAVGVGMMVPGLVLLRGTHGGIETSGPVARHDLRPSLHFGLAPGPSGAYAVARLVF